jgi:hypothetical protein
MTTARNLIAELRRLGATIVVADNRLRITAPHGAIAPSLREQLVQRKADVLRELRQEPSLTPADSGRSAASRIPSPCRPGSGFVQVVNGFRMVDGSLDFGDVCWGWTPTAWMTELRRKAARCDAYRPDIATYYREWADDIERRLPGAER